MNQTQQNRPAVRQTAGLAPGPAVPAHDQTEAGVAGSLNAARRPAAPGTPHPDPVLAARGWQACEHGHGVYVRHQPHRETDREAG